MIGIIAMIVALIGWVMFMFDKKNRFQWLGVALCGNLVQILYILQN